MVMPAAASISVSASMNRRPSSVASLRPIEDLPAPIMPTRTMERWPNLATTAAALEAEAFLRAASDMAANVTQSGWRYNALSPLLPGRHERGRIRLLRAPGHPETVLLTT